MSRLGKALILGFIVGSIGLAVRPAAVRLEEDFGLRWLFAARGPVDPPDDVVVVSVDRTSAQQLGLDTEKWPPPRHVYADVIRSLTRRGASAIMMDVFFRLDRSPEEDADLAEAIAESGKVTLFARVDRLTLPDGKSVDTIQAPTERLRSAAVAMAPFPVPEGGLVHFFWAFFDGADGSTPTLPAVALQVHALALVDRFVSVLQQAGVRNLADLPRPVVSTSDCRKLMEVFRRELRNNQKAAEDVLTLLKGGDVGDLSPGDRSVLVALVKLYSGSDTYNLNFYGRGGRIRTIPFHELLQDVQNVRFDLSRKVVIVGEGASTLVESSEQPDTFRTAYSTDGVDLSGAEIAATAFANLLTDRTVRGGRDGSHRAADLAILAGFGAVVAVLARLLPGLYAVGATLLLGLAFSALALHQFAARSWLVPIAVPLLVQLPVSLSVGVVARYRDIRRQVPKEVDPNARPEVGNGVCLSTDIENYTALSEIAGPRELALLMSEYYDTLSRLVTRRQGLLMGRAGDSAMCVWSRRKRRPSRARRVQDWLPMTRRSDQAMRADACMAAIEIREAIDRFNERHSTERLVTRIGLHCGEIALGPVGGEYHVIGDTPNTASRIEGVNKLLATRILASDAVVRDLAGFRLRPVGTFALPGKSTKLAIVEIIGQDSAPDPGPLDLCQRFAEGLRAFESGNHSEAARLYQSVASDYPADGPTRYYLTLCRRHLLETVGNRNPQNSE